MTDPQGPWACAGRCPRTRVEAALRPGRHSVVWGPRGGDHPVPGGAVRPAGHSLPGHRGGRQTAQRGGGNRPGAADVPAEQPRGHGPAGDPALWADRSAHPGRAGRHDLRAGGRGRQGVPGGDDRGLRVAGSTAHDRARPGGPDGRGGRGAGRTRHAGGDGEGIHGRRGDHRGVHAPGTDAGAQRGPAAGDRGDRQGRPRQRSGRRNQRHRGHGADRVGPGPAGRRRATADRPPTSGRPAW